ncbi:quinone-dependent dihydroorotate dehydrogenase [Pelagibacteraceae bacterium]|nr:quinone-dependent dihydroorotate dehydrogenase [Pelagibacteraceae bacterium]
MFSLLKPFIFKIDPEMAHDLAIKSLKYNFLPEDVFKVENEEILETEIFKIKIKNPIGLAAGFDKSAEVYNSLFRFGFGFIEVGTVTPKKQYGNPKPRVFRLENDGALINRLGFNNDGLEKITKRLQKNSPNGFLGINIGPNKDSKNRVDDYIKCLKEVHLFANYVTINISSPNTPGLRDFHNESSLQNLLKDITEFTKKNKIKKPLTLKISPDIADSEISYVIDLVKRFSIQGIVISNTTDKNRENLTGKNKNEVGGLSGEPLTKISNNLIKKFYKEIKGDIPIIGVGGVNSGLTAYEKLKSGASLLQLYTGMIYEGPGIVKKIKAELISILEKEKIKNVSEIVGTGS